MKHCSDCGEMNPADIHTCSPQKPAQQEPVGKFAKFTDGIWREVTDGSAGVPLYTFPPAQQWTDETANVPDRVCDEKCVAGHCGWPSGCADSKRCKADNTPPPCPTCEALARTVMMDHTGRDT